MRECYHWVLDYYRRGDYGAAIAEFEKVLQLKTDQHRALKLIEAARKRMKIKK